MACGVLCAGWVVMCTFFQSLESGETIMSAFDQLFVLILHFLRGFVCKLTPNWGPDGQSGRFEPKIARKPLQINDLGRTRFHGRCGSGADRQFVVSRWQTTTYDDLSRPGPGGRECPALVRSLFASRKAQGSQFLGFGVEMSRPAGRGFTDPSDRCG